MASLGGVASVVAVPAHAADVVEYNYYGRGSHTSAYRVWGPHFTAHIHVWNCHDTGVYFYFESLTLNDYWWYGYPGKELYNQTVTHYSTAKQTIRYKASDTSFESGTCKWHVWITVPTG